MRAPPSSYEMLVSYADGELDSNDRELLLSLLDLDSDLNREVWELRKLKEMVDISYQELPAPLPEPVHRARQYVNRPWPWQLATLLLVTALGVALYLLANDAGVVGALTISEFRYITP